MPITDNMISNPQSIYNDGSAAVCTENAYILFYKQRDCMRNEKWWTNWVDRALYDYDEFHYFLSNLDLIEKHQLRNQTNEQNKQLQFNHQQNQVQIVSKENYETHINSMKKISSGGLKTLRKFLGNSNSNSRNVEYQSSNERENGHEALSKDFTYQHEFNRKNERLNQQGVDSIRNSNSDVVLLNCYDEVIRPKRLLKQSNPSNSSNSLNAEGSSCSVSSLSPISKQNASQVPGINLNNLILTNDQHNSNLLNYPSDNDYTNFNEGTNYQSDFRYNQTPRYVPEMQNTPASSSRINTYNTIVPSKSIQTTLNGQLRSSNQNIEKPKNRYVNSTSIETNI
jgi:hypothetical protein